MVEIGKKLVYVNETKLISIIGWIGWKNILFLENPNRDDLLPIREVGLYCVSSVKNMVTKQKIRKPQPTKMFE